MIIGIDHVQLAAPQVSDIEGVANRLTTAGYAVFWDDSIPGTHRFYTTDPFVRMEIIRYE